MVRSYQNLLLLTLLLVAGASSALSQTAAQALNYNVHKGKHDTGGFGIGLMLGAMLSGDAYKGTIVSNAGGGGRLGDGSTVYDRTQAVAGISFAYQMGSDSEFVGTDLSLDIVSHQLEVTGPDFGTITSSATVAKFGFDFIINFYKSEFVERDGRRTRNSFNLSMLVGPNLGLLFGDFADLNGLSSIGLDIGLAMDIPVNDSIQLDPAMWLEMNYHLSDQVDIGTFDATDSGLVGPGAGTSRNLDGLIVRSHTFLPPYALNLGGDLVFTPMFIGRRGDLINSWRFNVGLFLTAPLAFNAFAADLPGDPLYTDKSRAAFVTLSFGASYFW